MINWLHWNVAFFATKTIQGIQGNDNLIPSTKFSGHFLGPQHQPNLLKICHQLKMSLTYTYTSTRFLSFDQSNLYVYVNKVRVMLIYCLDELTFVPYTGDIINRVISYAEYMTPIWISVSPFSCATAGKNGIIKVSVAKTQNCRLSRETSIIRCLDLEIPDSHAECSSGWLVAGISGVSSFDFTTMMCFYITNIIRRAPVFLMFERDGTQ